MKLPEIGHLGVPDRIAEVVRGRQVEAAARNRLIDTLGEGLAAFGQAVVKAQFAEASAKALASTAEIRQRILAKKSYTTAEVREALGDEIESLDPAVRAELTRQGFDVNSGQPIEIERDDIPSFLVADKIFEVQARRAVAEASRAFSSGGWAAEFQDRALREVAEQRASLAAHHLKEAHEYVRRTTTDAAVDLAYAGSYELARETIRTANLDADYKAHVIGQIDKIEQTAPLYEAIRADDVGAMAQYLGKLENPEEFDALSPEERTQFSERFKAEIKDFERRVKAAEEEKYRQIRDEAWAPILAKKAAGRLPTLRDLPPPGVLRADDYRQMIDYVNAGIKAARGGDGIKTNFQLYEKLHDMARNQPDAFVDLDLFRYRNQLDDTEFKELVRLKDAVARRNEDSERFDNFVSTAESVNRHLRDMGFDPISKNKSEKRRIGFLRNQIQRELDRAQRAKGGDRLSLEEREDVITRTLTLQVRETGGFLGIGKARVIPLQLAGRSDSEAAAFQRAAEALGAKNADEVLELHGRFAATEPVIGTLWNELVGEEITPEDEIQVWYYVEAHRERLEAALRASGGWTEDETVRRNRLVALALQEINDAR